MSTWVIFLGALAVFLPARLIAYRMFRAAWTSGRLSGRAAAAVFSVLTGIVPIGAALWLVVFSEDRLLGAVLLAIWLVVYAPLAVALIAYAERYGVRDEMRRVRRPPTDRNDG